MEGHRGRTSANDKKAPLGFKWCSLCGEIKRLAEFNVERRHRVGRVVLQPYDWCKPCAHAAQRRRYQKGKADNG